MNSAQEPVGSVEVALKHATRLLQTDPALAAEQAREILKVVPDQPLGLLVLGAAKRGCGELSQALAVLRPLAAQQKNWALPHYELGLTLGADGNHAGAITALRHATRLRPDFADAWRALGDELICSDDGDGADSAYAQYLKASTKDPGLLAAAEALCDNRIPEAEARLRKILQLHPNDVAALRMLAEVAARLRRYKDAETLLVRCLELAPGFSAARHNYAVVLHRRSQPAAALKELEKLLALEPRNPGYLNLKAAVLAGMGEFSHSLDVYREVLEAYPNQPKIWMSYGHALKTSARIDEGIAAYRKSIAQLPSLGEAYWSLANLKTFRFEASDVDAMKVQLQRGDLSDDDRLHLHFALGKALEDAGNYAQSFEHYLQGNELRRAAIGYDADETTRDVQRSIAVCTRDFFATRADYGSAAPDPIFIIGLPRSGSTLIEQILSSHSAVEGTKELAEIGILAKSLRDRGGNPARMRYPEALALLSAEDCRELGESYLSGTRIHRKTGAALFIDKMPNNFAHLGLMQLILPNAKIIDARRHPMACCFSGFKQHFARGQNFSYRLEDLGRYYRDYVELLAHFDAVLPGRIHRVIYEQMVADTEVEVRRLLAYCGLPFEEQCLRFFENERPVSTASSQQVRQPIYREGLDQWRHYQEWLGPLQEALGPVLPCYPDVPSFESRQAVA
ncbi:MAG TPA: sulfotransferase [Steroidobacteraceae bacterium]